MGRIALAGDGSRRNVLLAAAALLAAVLAMVMGTGSARADGTFSLSSNAYTVAEGDAVTITINRSGGTQNVQVTITVTAGSATEGADYVNPGINSYIFTVPGSNSFAFNISTIEDATPESNETFSVTISVPSGSSVGTASATVTIVDDDGSPKYSFQAASSSVTEGNTTHQVAVVREGSTAGTDSVTCSVSGGTATGSGTDYSFSNQTITFNPGDTGPKSCTVTIVEDAITESPDETIVLLLTGSSGFTGGAGTITTHTVTIVDDDGPGTIQFAQATYTVSEGAGTASIAVTRTNGSTGAASVQCSTVGGGTATAGSDYITVTSQVLNWANGDTITKFCTITILQDTSVESPETVNLQLSGVTGATLGTQTTAVLTITDDDGTGTIQFASATYSGTEAGGPIVISVTRTGGTSGAVTVDYATTGGTATAGVDYTAASGTLTWANGEGGTKTFTVTPTPDTLTEGTETVNLALSNPTGGATLGTPSTAVLQISDSTIIPVITAVNPAAGPTTGGQTVTITGQNFTGATSVTFGGVPCTSLTVVSSTQITCVTPANPAGTVEVIVTTPNGSNTTTGTANDYTYTTGPTVLSLNPSTGACNGTTIVTITGTNFTSSGMTVVFGTVQATFAYVSSTQITAVAPVQGAGVVDVRVTTPGGTSPNTAADDFTCTGTPIPTVTGLNPTSGPIGTTVTITGTNFTGATSVTFGGVTASFTVVSSTQITATVPAGTPAGVVDVRVTNATGTSVNTSADDFTNTSTSTIQYTLYRTFTLIVWTGADNKSIAQAIGGTQQGTTNVSGLIGAIWLFNPQTQAWLGYFPGSEGVPGANDFTTFRSGTAYFIALRPTAPAVVNWTAPAN
ncbi:Calx-beta domain-containing protein [Tepidiforma sp.]|uniref:Calx-beta domain-containing protein n=1 Tax=Tepidiforma sp. TaxID=2682230 RepID=UPI002ADE85F1|nr:Calx-beta domain-containing protein [Tepidiforma sp.]